MDEAEAGLKTSEASSCTPPHATRLAPSLSRFSSCRRAPPDLGQLGALVQPPRFEQVPDQPAEIRLQGTTAPASGSGRDVSNPNPFGFALGTLKGTLFLDDRARRTRTFRSGCRSAPGASR